MKNHWTGGINAEIADVLSDCRVAIRIQNLNIIEARCLLNDTLQKFKLPVVIYSNPPSWQHILMEFNIHIGSFKFTIYV